MISSRRLAREWALKILYQADIGKTSLKESQDASLQRLRLEFVQRGSRSAAGSFLEAWCLESITQHLADLPARIDQALEAGVREVITQCFIIGEFWKDVRVDFTTRRQSFSILLETPGQSVPIYLPIDVGAAPASIFHNPSITDEERNRLLRFAAWARAELPRQAIAAYTQEVLAGRPEGANLKATQEYVQAKWQHFTGNMQERWQKAGQTVQKQTSDWLRVAGFTIALVNGVHQNKEELDKALTRLATGWSLDRQVSVDRNILRMAAFEMLYLRDIPPSASINEAVELAKKYSTSESGRFVNGVLGALALQQSEHAMIVKNVAVVAELPMGLQDDVIDMDEIADREELELV